MNAMDRVRSLRRTTYATSADEGTNRDRRIKKRASGPRLVLNLSPEIADLQSSESGAGTMSVGVLVLIAAAATIACFLAVLADAGAS